MLRYAVLGTTEVFDDDRPVDLGGPLPRRLLTALIAAEGRAVPDDRLAALVWTGRPPGDVPAALQVYVSRLRRALGDAGRAALRRTPAGYALDTAPGTVDLAEFPARADAARRLTGRDAARAFDSALGLWRGEPFADLPADPELSAARARLHELRDTADEDRLAALLAAGEHAGAVPELESLVDAAPYRERRWAMLILGLYRGGRQAEALAALRRVRALLTDELGVDPGPELQRLERRVLAQDPSLLDTAPRTPLLRAVEPALPLTSFVGRDAELALLTDLVAAHRLVTVVGPAGAGKTRIAIEYAARHPGPGETWMVRLADITDPGALPSVAAATLGLTEGTCAEDFGLPNPPPNGLLVLDNCEHLVEPLVPLVVQLIRVVPGLRVLVTGREPLGLDGERLLTLGPLPEDAAAELLVDRIRAVRAGWTPDRAERDDLRQIATVLDRIPLTLELAAARARMLGVRDLLDHLDDRFSLLGDVPRNAVNPHATLAAAIAWSIDPLAAPDRELLLRLWPFEGGFPLEAAEAVRPGALESLSTLVSRSIVVADTTVSPTRYRLLETIREYCRRIDPDPAAGRRAHAEWVRRVVERGAADLRGERSGHAMRVLTRELPNIRAAIAHDLAASPPDALRTTGRLLWFWPRTGLIHEGLRLLTAAIDAAPDAPALDRARAWATRAVLEYAIGGVSTARPMILSAARMATGDPLYGEIMYYSALFQLPDGDAAHALAASEEAGRVGAETGQEWLVASALTTRGAALLMLGRTAEGREALRAAVEASLACGMRWSAAVAELLLAQNLQAGGEAPGAVLPGLERALRWFRQEDDASGELVVLYNRAGVLAAAGREEEAGRIRAEVDEPIARQGLSMIRTYARGAGRPGTG